MESGGTLQPPLETASCKSEENSQAAETEVPLCMSDPVLGVPYHRPMAFEAGLFDEYTIAVMRRATPSTANEESLLNPLTRQPLGPGVRCPRIKELLVQALPPGTFVPPDSVQDLMAGILGGRLLTADGGENNTDGIEEAIELGDTDSDSGSGSGSGQAGNEHSPLPPPLPPPRPPLKRQEIAHTEACADCLARDFVTGQATAQDYAALIGRGQESDVAPQRLEIAFAAWLERVVMVDWTAHGAARVTGLFVGALLDRPSGTAWDLISKALTKLGCSPPSLPAWTALAEKASVLRLTLDAQSFRRLCWLPNANPEFVLDLFLTCARRTEECMVRVAEEYIVLLMTLPVPPVTEKLVTEAAMAVLRVGYIRQTAMPQLMYLLVGWGTHALGRLRRDKARWLHILNFHIDDRHVMDAILALTTRDRASAASSMRTTMLDIFLGVTRPSRRR